MGLLRSTQLSEADGGYVPAAKGCTVNGVLLGEPILLGIAPIAFGWDDSRLVSGLVEIIDGQAVITPDAGE